MNKTLKGAIAAAGLTLASATGAFAQACAESDSIAPYLEQNFGETLLRSQDHVEDGVVVDTHELYANEQTGTWTAIVNYNDGTSCLEADGTAPIPTPDQW